MNGNSTANATGPSASASAHVFSGRSPRPLSAGILIAAAMAALFHLWAVGVIAQRESLWYDEWLTVSVAIENASVGDVESSPPLFFFLEHLSASHHPSSSFEYTVRRLSIFASGLTVVSLVLLAWRWGAAWSGWMMVLLAPTAPMLLWYGAEARPYALLVLWITLLLDATLDLVLRRRERLPVGRLMWWVALSVAALWTHYFAAVVVADVLLWWLVVDSARAGRIRASQLWWIAAGASLLAGAALVPLFVQQLNNDHTTYIAEPTAHDLLRAWFVALPWGLNAAYPAVLRALAAAPALFIMGWCAWKILSRVDWEQPRTLCAMLWIDPIVLLWMISFVRPVFLYDRFSILALPGFLGAVTMVLGEWATHRAEAPTGGKFPSAMSHAHPTRDAAAAGLCFLMLALPGLFQTQHYLAPQEKTIRFPWKQFVWQLPDVPTYYVPQDDVAAMTVAGYLVGETKTDSVRTTPFVPDAEATQPVVVVSSNPAALQPPAGWASAKTGGTWNYAWAQWERSE